MARLLDWIKATVKSVYPDKGNYSATLINVKWNTSDKAADLLHMQAMWNWLYDDLDIHPLTIPITQDMVNAMVKQDPFAWASLLH